ncbi:hypothetical protein [Herbaspirillum huttiense]|uniref:DUF5872 domain-containing protein n=1 Tax=Herbaspirillum huttiense subsp. lycopersici TaxID=3074428 RepID=A0ABU2EFY2_9BURK|nr:hypothetical protein [Herbaspirillum huttiense]MDR9847049.1 hypothetical protein [Herbaspirillum huttiense SE1]
MRENPNGGFAGGCRSSPWKSVLQMKNPVVVYDHWMRKTENGKKEGKSPLTPLTAYWRIRRDLPSFRHWRMVKPAKGKRSKSPKARKKQSKNNMPGL